jgi:hypothetical protein
MSNSYTVACTVSAAAAERVFDFYVSLKHLKSSHPLLIDVKVSCGRQEMCLCVCASSYPPFA